MSNQQGCSRRRGFTRRCIGSIEVAEALDGLVVATGEAARLSDVVRGLQQYPPFANAPQSLFERDEGARTGAAPVDPFSCVAYKCCDILHASFET